RNSTDDLSARQYRVQHLAYVLKRDEVIDRHAICSQIHGDFRDVHRPGKCSISLPSILFVVPENSARGIVTRPAPEWAVHRNILPASLAKLVPGIAVV